jgi:hypothetical protein
MPVVQWFILWSMSKPLPPPKVQEWFWRITLWGAFIFGTLLGPGLLQVHIHEGAIGILWFVLAYPASLLMIGMHTFLWIAILYGFRPALRVVYSGVGTVSYRALLGIASFLRRG